MAFQKAKEHLKKYGLENKIREFEVSSATVLLAAEAAGCEPERIAKSLTFKLEDRILMIVTAGDAKVDNAKYKNFFQTKAKMLDFEEVLEKTGHAVGGVCPFGINEGVEVYLDVSMKRFQTVFPAVGSDSSAVELSISQLEETSGYREWIDVCKGWE